MKDKLLLEINEGFSKPYYQKGHNHFLIYKLDGSIKEGKEGFYIPPVIYLSGLEFFIKTRKKTYNLHEHIKKVLVYASRTEHFFTISELKLDVKLTYFVVDEFTSLVIKIEPSKRKYKVIIKPKFSFDYVWHHSPSPIVNVDLSGNTLIAKSLFEKHLMTLIRFSDQISYKKNKIVTKLKKLEMHIIGSSSIMRISDMVLRSSMKYTRKGIKSKEKKYNNYLYKKTNFLCSDKEIEKAFILSKYNIRVLRHYQPGLGEGFFAGIPQYHEFFSRDTFWSLPGIVMSSDFENAKYALNLFTRYQSKLNTETKLFGEIPHEIWLTGEPNYYSADSTILYIYALYYYYKWSGDIDFIKKSFEHIEDAFNWIKKHIKHSLITNRQEGFLKGSTWMDSYNRSESTVEMQALLARCSFYIYILAKRLRKHELKKEAKEIYENARKHLNIFWTGNYYADRRKKTKNLDTAFTCNQLVVLMFKYANKKRAEKIFNLVYEKKLRSRLGIRTRAKKTAGYKPGKYHKGMIWPLTTAFGILAAFNYKNFTLGKELLETFKQMFTRYVPGFIPECVHGNKFTLKFSGEKFKEEKDHFTNFLQLWSAALFIQTIIEGLFGVNPLPHKKIVKIRPLPIYDYFEIKNLRVFDSIIDIKVKNKKLYVKVKEGKVKIVRDASLLKKGIEQISEDK